jgi:hypothetical protein
MPVSVITLLVAAAIGAGVALFAWWCGAFHWVDHGRIGAFQYWENVKTGERQAVRIGRLGGWCNRDWLDGAVDLPTQSLARPKGAPPPPGRR